ncbi:unnamed protein product [Paramecium pentaurelia]|uniref:Protein kinase domain-containing protein n=1 Tax=Paramecium pentaurelia TaxID=43138 RepID=A0A8S1VEU3_9CILI|nr:unnamed protein product [Paramecium pentaurelia]
MKIIELQINDGKLGFIKQVQIGNKLYAIKQFKHKGGDQEYRIHKLLKHPNILNFINGNENYIVTELMIPFDLYFFVKTAGSMSVNTSNYILKQLVDALKYMHQLRIAHRDVKLENVLVDEQNYQIKLCDFDASESLDSGKVHNQVGTSCYMSPEINFYGKIDAQNLIECDIHALGVLYYILLFGKYPFNTTNKSCSLYILILKNNWDKFWYYSQRNRSEKIPISCLELIEGMINYDPKKRLTLDEILYRIGQINEIEYINEMKNVHYKLQVGK